MPRCTPAPRNCFTSIGSNFTCEPIACSLRCCSFNGWRAFWLPFGFRLGPGPPPRARCIRHVWAAVVLGGMINSLPIALAILAPWQIVTRHAIAIAQMCTSAILIHISGGRIETHFMYSGRWRFCAFYRDWKVLITASAVVATDHFARGLYWPQSVYGVLMPGWWRWLEHAGWVVFEDVILIYACVRGMREMEGIAHRTAQLEATNIIVENRVVERTKELVRARQSCAWRRKLPRPPIVQRASFWPT